MKALKDLWYLVAIWMIARVNPIGASALMKDWSRAVCRDYEDRFEMKLPSNFN